MASTDAPILKNPQEQDDLLAPPESLFDDNGELKPDKDEIAMDVDSAQDEELDWDDGDIAPGKGREVNRASEELKGRGRKSPAEHVGTVSPTPSSESNTSDGDAQKPPPQLLRGGGMAQATGETDEMTALRHELADAQINLMAAQRSESRMAAQLEAMRVKEIQYNTLLERVKWLDARAAACDEAEKRILELEKDKVRLETQLDAWEDQRRRKRSRASTVVTEESSSTGDNNGDAVMADIQVTNKPPLISQSPDKDISTTSSRAAGSTYNERETPEEAKERLALPKILFPRQPPLPVVNRPGLPSVDAFVMLAPPEDWSTHVTDARGFPADEATWQRTFDLQTSGQHWVYALRHLYMWSYGRGVPISERTAVLQLAVDHYSMPDWVANVLTALGRQGSKNDAAIERFRDLKRSTIGYNPMLLAMLIQYRESSQRGCPFIDDSWSLDMRLVRGHNLFDILASGPSYMEGGDRLHRICLERVIIELMATPGHYQRLLARDHHAVRRKLEIVPWTVKSAAQITMDELAETLSQMGVPPDLIDDSFAFAHAWLREIAASGKASHGWTLEQINHFIDLAYGKEAPPGLQSSARDLLLRHPALPWQTKAENALQYWMSDWRHPELQGLRREPGSDIQRIVSSGQKMREPPRDLGVLKRLNPYTKIRKTAAKPTHREFTSPALTSDFISGPITTTQVSASKRKKGKSSRMFNPTILNPTTSFAQTQQPYTFVHPSNVGFGPSSHTDPFGPVTGFPQIMGVTAPPTSYSGPLYPSSGDTNVPPQRVYSSVPQHSYASGMSQPDDGYDYDPGYNAGETNSYGGLEI
ncbi:hypothetical protein DFH09DRAFT_1331676 [Mycena vulgaris]|nr:hypothetical protein DFH09DRAFT_1331676 [Mycena vulgaris]